MLKTTPNFALSDSGIHSGIHVMAIHFAAAERGGLIKKEKERKLMGKT